MFRQLNVRIEGLPIEEAGVEHVLRGIRDASVVSIYNQVFLKNNYMTFDTIVRCKSSTYKKKRHLYNH